MPSLVGSEMCIRDRISPCVTFNNNDESLRSYGYVKDNQAELHSVGYIPHFSPLEQVEVPAGSFRDINLHDGSTTLPFKAVRAAIKGLIR